MHYAMLLQDSTPDTSPYMVAGYVVFAMIMAIYLVSFLARGRNLERDLTTLEAMQTENRATASPPAPRKRTVRKAKSPQATSGGRSRAKKRAARRR